MSRTIKVWFVAVIAFWAGLIVGVKWTVHYMQPPAPAEAASAKRDGYIIIGDPVCVEAPPAPAVAEATSGITINPDWKPTYTFPPEALNALEAAGFVREKKEEGK